MSVVPTTQEDTTAMSSTNGAGAGRSVPIDQAEALLRSLAGVRAVKISGGPDGKTLRIRLEADGSVSPQQLVRNVQSALLARFGLLVDTRTIEIVTAQTGGYTGLSQATGLDSPSRDSEKGSVGAGHTEQHLVRGHAPVSQWSGCELLDRPILERLRQHRVRCRIELGLGQRVVHGEAEVVDGFDAALDAAARAVLAAIRTAYPECGAQIELEGVRNIELAGRSYVMVGVRAVERRGIQHLAGASVVEESGEEAAALAAINAVEQWFTRQKPTQPAVR